MARPHAFGEDDGDHGRVALTVQTPACSIEAIVQFRSFVLALPPANDLSTSRFLMNAEPIIDKPTTTKPTMAAAHVSIGNTFLHKNDPQTAVKEFQEYLKLDPNGPMAEPTKAAVAKLEKRMASQK